MRVDRLTVVNFKGFTSREFQFHPEFNLLVGENGSGKTSVLDALSVAIAGWLLGFRGKPDTRHIRSHEVRLAEIRAGKKRVATWEAQYPCAIEAAGEVQGEAVMWRRALNTSGGRTTSGEARLLRNLAATSDDAVRSGREVLLPLISYYGTGRLWNVPRETAQVSSRSALARWAKQSRLAGYRNSVDPRLSVSELVGWIARQAWTAFQRGSGPPALYRAVSAAIAGCVEGAKDISYDASLGEVVVDMGVRGRQPFNNLSDGQRSMLAMVGDIAQKAIHLNPHLESDALRETPGVVLIDELDLHLHPRWQRHLIEDLRSIFPKIQFFATTHSPFLIQSLRSGEELVMLDGQPVAELGNKPIEEIARGIMGVANPQVSARYEEMTEVARHYLENLERARLTPAKKLDKLKQKLEESIAPYADNPAYQAFLRMKRVAELGE
ncbi:MAG: AAA family ATPase [Bryobacterales bacterium]|nr:AAA family ATPase [Bryobacterales bacterium]